MADAEHEPDIEGSRPRPTRDLRPRTKPRWTAGVGCATAAASVALLLAAYLVWANRPLPIARVVPRGPLPSPNGYDVCQAAFRQLARVPRSRVVERPWKESPDALRVAVVPYRGALSQLRGALRHAYRTPPGPPELPGGGDILFLRAGFGYVSEARVSLAEGQDAAGVDHALDAIELAARLSHGADDEWFLVPSVVGHGVRAIDGHVYRLTEAEARRAGARVDRIIGEVADVREVLANQYSSDLESIRVSMLDRTPEHLMEMMNGRSPTRWQLYREQAGILFYPKPLVYVRMEAYLRRRNEALVRGVPIESLPAAPTGWLSAGYLDNGSEVAASHRQLVASLRLIRLEIALQQYRRQNRSYPPDLGELTKLVPTAIVVDPYAGRAFRYAQKGEGYLLYSVGANGRDDGGEPNRYTRSGETGDLVAGLLYPR